MSSELDLAMQVVHAVHAAGGRALFVGGWVRDRLLSRKSRDIDIEVYGLNSEAIRSLLTSFGRVVTVGESFTVYKLGPIDISMPRRESKSGHGHGGFTVVGDPTLSIADAARRRDFTINAIAWDPLSAEYLDPVGGQDDLKCGVLRVVDPDRFAEDSLRVLRGIQIAARFELAINPATAALCQTIPLDDLPAERVWGEMEKLFLKSCRPSHGLTVARELGVVEKLFPQLAALVGCEQEPEWHPEGDVWVHTLLVVDEAAGQRADLPYPQQVALMLGAVCHDFGKPSTSALIDGRIRSRNHEEAGVQPTLAFLDCLNLHTLDGYDVRGQVTGLVANHLKPGMWHKAPDGVGDGAFRRLAKKVDLNLLARLATADCRGRTGTFDCSAMTWFLDRARALGVEHDAPAPLLRGRHLLNLGLSSGPHVGRLLGKVYERQLDGEVRSLDEAIEVAQRIIQSES